MRRLAKAYKAHLILLIICGFYNYRVYSQKAFLEFGYPWLLDNGNGIGYVGLGLNPFSNNRLTKFYVKPEIMQFQQGRGNSFDNIGISLVNYLTLLGDNDNNWFLQSLAEIGYARIFNESIISDDGLQLTIGIRFWKANVEGSQLFVAYSYQEHNLVNDGNISHPLYLNMVKIGGQINF